MFVRWQYPCDRKRSMARHYWEAKAFRYAVLVESARIDGKPRQRHVAYLGDVLHLNDQDVHYRAWWWHRMTAKLDQLGNVIPPDQRPRIEAVLAKAVAPVTAAEVTKFDLDYQHKMRVEAGFNEGPVCYPDWPEGTEGVPPRPKFEKRERFANVIAAVTAK